MTTTRIIALQKRKEELDERLKKLISNDIKQAVKLENRRKIILGGWLLKHRPDLVKNIVLHGLVRRQDINAFADWAEDNSSTTPSELAKCTE